jgi:hypothetical protein
VQRGGEGGEDPAALTGQDPAGGERGAVSQRLDLVVDGLVTGPGDEEVGVERLGPQVGIGGAGGGQEGLGEELAAEEVVGLPGRTPEAARTVLGQFEALEQGSDQGFVSPGSSRTGGGGRSRPP